jgi:cellulose synthase/poly-beta-1,6-N-acetylglucosamine synthase-like glycosyltransferase
LYLYSLTRKKKTSSSASSIESDYAIIITAYQYTETLPALISSVLSLNHDNFLVYIVADNCDVTNLKFNDDRIILLNPDEVLAGNTKSHFYAINRFKRSHDRLVIIDSDNLVDSEFLNQLDLFFENGYEAVQGTREAKNLNTTYACLDAARDIYYHFYDGKLLFKIGSSATLAGSGMAFTTELYKACLENKKIIGAGFDKVLQYEIVKRNKIIAFAPKAIVYDEKTSHSDQLVNQRSRWINTWFKYFKYGFKLLLLGTTKLNTNQFFFGLILLRPPLFIFLLLSIFCAILNGIFNPLVSIFWIVALFSFIIAFIISLKNSNTDKRIYKSLINIPKFIFYQIISLANIKRANKRSVSTQPFTLDIEIKNISKKLKK